MSADVETADFSSFQLGLTKSPSPDYIPDDESASVCPLIAPSPTSSAADFIVSSMDTLPIVGKSSSPDFMGVDTRDSESSSICPLLTPSPTVVDFSCPMDPLSSLAYEMKDESNLNLMGRNDSDVTDNSDGKYMEFDLNRKSGSISDEGGEQQITFTAKLRNMLPGDLAESSASSSSSALQENTSCVQLLGNHHYQHLNSNQNDVKDFIPQENGLKPTEDITGQKLGPDYSFLHWNWPFIRKSCFWTVIALMTACIGVVIAMVATLPRRCYPNHYWYQGTVFYEIFPASFQDSNTDGIGDFRGIASRIEYLEKLGIHAIRLNSIFPSDHYPEEFYKIKNLTEIEKSLGTIRDFTYLLDVLHNQNISVILDLPIYPLVKDLGDLNINLKKDSIRKDVEGKITSMVHNHRSHRDVENATEAQHPPMVDNSWQRIKRRSQCCGGEETHIEQLFDPRLLALKPEPYIDGGISGLMKHTSQHLNSIAETLVADAIKFWFELGVDGIYIKGLEHYVHNQKFGEELKKWRKIAYNYWRQDKEKLLMCSYEVYNEIIENRPDLLDTLLHNIDLLDVYLDLSNGTKAIKAQVDFYQNSKVYDKRQYPWIHWNIGNVNTKRLSSQISPNGSLGAILFELMLPGTVSIFYGDEIGLPNLQDPHGDLHDVRHIHQLTPMIWNEQYPEFTRNNHLPWLGYAVPYTSATGSSNGVVGMLAMVRHDSPSIYMNSIWKENDNLMNYAIRYVDDHVIVMERSYPRRNSYVVVSNMGQTSVTRGLSHIYYGGDVVTDLGRFGEYLTFKALTLGPGETIVIKLDK